MLILYLIQRAGWATLLMSFCFEDLRSLRMKTFCSGDVCGGDQGEWDSPCWCWADPQWGHSQSDSDFMLSWFVCYCFRLGVYSIKSCTWRCGCGWCVNNHFLETWARAFSESFSPRMYFVFCEHVFQEVRVFHRFAKIRFVSEEVFPELCICIWSISKQILRDIFQFFAFNRSAMCFSWVFFLSQRWVSCQQCDRRQLVISRHFAVDHSSEVVCMFVGWVCVAKKIWMSRTLWL